LFTLALVINMKTEEIWKSFQRQLHRYIVKRVAMEEDADDILQSIFEKVHKNKEAIKTINNITGWLYAITKNAIIDYYRNKKDLDPITYELAEPEREPNFDEADFYFSCMNSFIGKLSKEEQRILKEVLSGKSIKSVAEEMNKSYSTVKSKVQRSKGKIRKEFVACCNIRSLSNQEDNNLYCESC